jgi:hypothetical protein
MNFGFATGKPSSATFACSVVVEMASGHLCLERAEKGPTASGG